MANTGVLKKGDLIEGYAVQFFIESNDEAEVYRVKDEDGIMRRLKVYPLQSLSKNRFDDTENLREIKILSSLNHPSIIKLIDSGETQMQEQKWLYMVTDFVSGESLLDKLKREGVQNPYNVIPTALQILDILEYLHNLENPVIHNDICLENIIMSYSKNGEIPVLTNFSSAVFYSSSTKTFHSDLQNPFYMASEQFSGITLPQSDLFSLGALIYHLCFGIPPWYFEVEDKSQFLPRLIAKRRNDLSFESNHIEVFDSVFLNIVKKALSPDLNSRFKSATEMKSALNREINVQMSSGKGTTTKKKIKKNGNGFSDIAGMTDLKEMLANDVIKAITEKELYDSYGITIPNGLLLYGPPGCGKTFIAEKFAEEIGFNFVKLNPSDVKSKYINATEENIGKIFNDAEEVAPSILFFDEFDALVPSRESNLHHMNASSVNELLAQMSNCGERGIFVIAATNRPDKIDPAVLRSGRIDKKIYVSPPDDEARKQMFKLHLAKRPTDFSIDYNILSIKTNFCVASDIKFIVDEASRLALSSNERISQNILLKSIDAFRPSISEKDLNYYKSLQNKLEGKVPSSGERRRIGFK